ncbi:MAG: hypothetical protein AB2421_10260 [Thermotaleaceae bacterium]
MTSSDVLVLVIFVGFCIGSIILTRSANKQLQLQKESDENNKIDNYK